VSNGKSKVCVIFGDPIAHTLSPAFHGAGYRALGIDDDYVFVAARVSASDLPKALSGARAMNLHAVTCTMPHKEAVIRLLDGVDEAAQRIGAVNSIVNREGRFLGYNTDWIGIINSLKRRRAISGAKAVVIGAGGTARAAVFGLKSEGADVIILNRTPDRAEALGLSFGCSFGDLAQHEVVREADIVLQTTAVGLNDETATPLSEAPFRKGQLVLDVVYRPKTTAFLKRAEECGAEIVRGEEVFVEQGIAQFELYTGLTPPRAPLEAVLRNAP